MILIGQKSRKLPSVNPPHPGQKLQGSQIEDNNSYLQKAQFPDIIKLDTKYLWGGTMGNKVLAMNNGSGCTGCSACEEGIKAQEKCEGFEKATHLERCMWLKFNRYCDNPKMQGR